MFLTRSEYDRGVNTFSPEGRLFQVEYAIEAVKHGETAIGIKTPEGVVLTVEKRCTSELIVPSSIEKIKEIDSHIGCATTGIQPDADTLVNRARIEAQNHWFTYNESMTIESVTQSVSNLALAFGDDANPSAMSRPFGVSLLFAGWDEKGPQLYHMDPSGTFIEYVAKAIGQGAEGANQSLKDIYPKPDSGEVLLLNEAKKHSLKILKHVMENKMSNTNVEMATVTKEGDNIKFIKITEVELQDIITEIGSEDGKDDTS